ncbi:Voltage-dependent calcium channel subunit alpha-2/delta-3 [Channa argus]|uniref:Voltage-dependent calcium channel subunit alpha-2/delta-3 n=1 Tax=Channa argus TaxID=215402 RepID=A0A6G1Q3L8_CHAAH|nr:Voltage-dependent calcium channel subunit alpha-2/delta-3 [Channa argus]
MWLCLTDHVESLSAVGIQMKLEFFQKKFWTASRQCAALDGKCSISCDEEDINCYLIDNNGFILVAEDYTLPYFAFFSAIKWILSELIIFLVEFNFYSWWYSDVTAKAQRIGRTMQVPCDTEYPAFISERTIKENTGNIECEGCIKSFVIQQIPSSNLFMVVVDNKCDCSMFEPITMDPVEIMYILHWPNTGKVVGGLAQDCSLFDFHGILKEQRK